MGNENQENYRATPIEWDGLNRHVIDRLKISSIKIHTGRAIDADAEVQSINSLLDREGLIGLEARVQSTSPIITTERITPFGIEYMPVYDSELHGSAVYQGTLMGCSVLEYENVDKRVLAYDISTETSEGLLRIQTVHDVTSIEIAYPSENEEDDIDVLVAGAFAVLGDVQDEPYAEAVECIKETYEDNELAPAHRMQMLGAYASILIAHPEHDATEARVQALHTILGTSVDTGITYTVAGFEASNVRTGDDSITLKVKPVVTPFTGRPVAITYVRNFEIATNENNELRAELGENAQPAITFYDPLRRTEHTMVMRYLSLLTEEGYIDDEASASTISCGEVYRLFWERVENGAIIIEEGVALRALLNGSRRGRNNLL